MALTSSDLPAMYSLLKNSLSGDQTLRKPAEAALSQSENRPGFCSCLMEVITAKDLASQPDVRLLASVYFKNGVIRYWRHRRDSQGIGHEEKIHLRQKLLSHLREENNKIALQLAVLISKIARVDYPREWPELFSVLAQQLQSADVLTSHRIFMVLYRTLKELSSKRLTLDQRNFAEISSHLFQFSWQLWQNDWQAILSAFSALTQSFASNAPVEHQDDLYLTCERWLFCLKVVRQLIISGFQSDAKSMQEVRPVKEVCPVLLNAIQLFLPYYSSFLERHHKFCDFTKRLCTKLMKVLVSVQGRHPYSFGDECVLRPVMDFCLARITNPEQEIESFEQFQIQCMIMVKTILECKEYKPSLIGRVINENGVSREQMKKVAVCDVLASLLPGDRVVFLCNILIRRYFVFTASDLEVWYQSPESFHHEQDMVQWTEKLRPCAEALFIVLFENHTQLLAPVVVSILQEAMNGCPASETAITPGMLLKDAAYGAAGHVSYQLSNYLNFKDWFNAALSLELMNGHPNMRIVHREVALLLGQWVSEIKEDTKRPIYCAMVKLLQGKDIAVKLAACRSLWCLVDNANFSEQDFCDLLPTCFDLLFKLVEEVQEFDSKVWEDSSGESLLQIQLLVALQHLVVALGHQSPMCYNVLLPILQRGIDVNSPDELNLLEDSVLLWEVTLANAPSMVPQLLGFFPSLVNIMERSFDHLEVATSIVEDYIILGGTEFLNLHASSVAKLLDEIVGNVNDRGLKSTLPVIEILIQCFPMEVPSLIATTLQKLIVICLSGGGDRDPLRTAVKTSSAAILARVLVTNTDYFAHLTSESSLSLALQQGGVSVKESVLLCLVDVWLEKVLTQQAFSKFNSLHYPCLSLYSLLLLFSNKGFLFEVKVDSATAIQQKTFGLALAIILTLRVPEVLDKIDQILSICTSILFGKSDELNDESSGDSISSTGSHHKDILPTKDYRKRQIQASDPIKNISLETSLRDNLQVCATLHGDASFNAAISRMHPSVFAQLQQALKMTSVR
ncbi:hypothetical protein IFM89_023465 [Coptis chinensis]|uniref:Importin N-terminal domain-containing protein n=1 Tax=Coptis chinensis TaxID=261450 RepID=A0A835HCM8_9MAGN|nr:hypothetical protein IFM89_023465 [Coptis chinensis]